MKVELEQLQPEVQLKAKVLPPMHVQLQHMCYIPACIFQDVEALLLQLTKEQQGMNQLKATVEQERSSFAKESQIVTDMAAVSF